MLQGSRASTWWTENNHRNFGKLSVFSNLFSFTGGGGCQEEEGGGGGEGVHLGGGGFFFVIEK